MVTLTRVRSDPSQLNTPEAQTGYQSDDLSDNAHRQLIGYIGLVLPILLILMAMLRDGMERWRSLESISDYYYTGAVAAFVGMLVALALFLFTYRGYKNKYHWADRAAAITAAVAALGVAFFPTAAPAGVTALSWWSPRTGVLHYVSAVVLFTMFAVFALWIFRITPSGKQASADKWWRNIMYLVCGIAIVASIIWAGIAGLNRRSIFLPESVALVAFAVSWLVKGYAHRTIADTARSLLRR
jgi:succinate dehydrogenase/fumarate reductase cytochrome b subunit